MRLDDHDFDTRELAAEERAALPAAAQANRPPDQLRDCERCGVIFLWSSEEQAAPAGRTAATGDGAAGEGAQEAPHGFAAQAAVALSSAPPTHCPGCRRLLPQSDRERGLVKWFNGRKRYGFFMRYDAPEIFAHGSNIQGRARLHPGDLVEFSVAMSERGPEARAITLLQKGE